jgi:hypothetical protein
MTRLPGGAGGEKQPGQKQSEPLVGLRGWLLFYIAGACFAPANAFSATVDLGSTIEAIKGAWAHSLPWTLGMVSSLFVQGGIAVGSVYGLYLIFTQNRATRTFHVALWQAAAVAGLVCAAALMLGSSAMAGHIPLIVNGAEVQGGLPPFLVTLPHLGLAATAAIWWQYWKKSVRVRNTFPEDD